MGNCLRSGPNRFSDSRSRRNHTSIVAPTRNLRFHDRRLHCEADCRWRGCADRSRSSGVNGDPTVAQALGVTVIDCLARVGRLFMSRGMIKTGLGRRIAFLFIRAIGKHSLGLGYALVLTDMLLAMVIPSNGARAGGIIFPVAKSLAEAYDSRPGETANRLGSFLMTLIYQCDVIVCAMFLTGQASNVLIAKFAQQ